jgi:acyl-CoA synthetase (AMP-forming)/AMP-acid ligase II/acyl carrier protein
VRTEVPPSGTIAGLLRAQAKAHPDAPALLGPGRESMSYSGLQDQTLRLASQLRAMGIAKRDRVAIVLPNGPEMASAFLAVATCSVAAPLNSAYRTSEFDFYLSDLNARALLIARGTEGDAVAAARARGIPLIEVASEGAFAGAISLHGPTIAKSQPDAPEPHDIALILHTSGTTSRPKIVPLTQSNLCASAHNISTWLSLSPADCCLNVMPLFHIHGLVAALLASLDAGARVACSEGFVATRFWERLEEFNPTWYTAVPTMHQAIVARPEAGEFDRFKSRLRFVRSSSAALPPQVEMELERVFGVPVVEAAHQMCCNPLPPRERKLGSVGLPAGPDVAVMNDAGELLPPGQRGEVVIRGANVTPGYENNPAANQSAFTHGWFRTGDLGHIDPEGYVVLAGRLKEIINRGGEKISPREIDEVLLDHPSIQAALCFAIPDPRLGEEIGAAVVLRTGASATDVELMNFAATRLADFKVPRRVLILDEIPKGPTGKPQRIGLAAKLGLDGTQPNPVSPKTSAAPQTDAERTLARIWCEVLKLESVSAGDDFFALGGDSVLAAQVIARIHEKMQRDLPMPTFFTTRTLGAVADAIDACPQVTTDPNDVETMLDDIESMTDEEAERMLESIGNGEVK